MYKKGSYFQSYSFILFDISFFKLSILNFKRHFFIQIGKKSKFLSDSFVGVFFQPIEPEKKVDIFFNCVAKCDNLLRRPWKIAQFR